MAHALSQAAETFVKLIRKALWYEKRYSTSHSHQAAESARIPSIFVGQEFLRSLRGDTKGAREKMAGDALGDKSRRESPLSKLKVQRLLWMSGAINPRLFLTSCEVNYGGGG